MACTLKQTIKDKITEGNSDFIVNENNVIVPNNDIRNKEQTLNLANSITDRINAEYLGDKVGNPLSVSESEAGATINIHISDLLQKMSDMRDSSASKIEGHTIKQGVSELFESNPELANIGTQTQYSQYLDTIFPDSKVKDIVYHGTDVQFEEFKKGFGNWSDAFWFDFSGSYKQKYQIKSVVNIKNPFSYGIFQVHNIIENKFGKEQLNELIKYYKNPSDTFLYVKKDEFEIEGELVESYAVYDSNGTLVKAVKDQAEGDQFVKDNTPEISTVKKEVIELYEEYTTEKSPDVEGGQFIKQEKIKELQTSGFDSIRYHDYLAVFEPDQIHILGSKQDVEGFKDFVQGKQFQNPNNIKLQINSEKGLGLTKQAKKVLDFLEKNFSRIAENTKIIRDQEEFDRVAKGTEFENSGGIYATGTITGEIYIYINPRMENSETFVHELLHAFTEVILNNPQTEEEKEFVKTVFELWNNFRNMKGAKELNNGYQFNDMSEFLIYSLTNRDMQNFLKTNNEAKNLLQKVVDLVKKLFGLKQSDFDRLFKITEKTINSFDYSKIKERILESQVNENKGQNKPFNEETEGEELFSRIKLDNSEKQQKIINHFENQIKNLSEKISEQGGVITFEKLVAGLANNKGFGLYKLDEYANMIVKAWENAENQPVTEDDRKILDSILKDVKIIENSSEILLPSQDSFTSSVREDVKEADEILEDKDSKKIEKEFSITYSPLSESKYKESGLKAGGFLTLDYEREEEGKKKNKTTKVNLSAFPFLDYRNFKQGSSVEVVFNHNYLFENNGNNLISIWGINPTAEEIGDSLEDGKDYPEKKTITVKSWIKILYPNMSWEEFETNFKDFVITGKTENNPIFKNKNTVNELLKKLPIGISNNNLTSNISEGEVINGGLPDYYWFNNENVALRMKSEHLFDREEREKRIKENQEQNIIVRLALLASMKEGKPLKLQVESRSDVLINRPLMTEEDVKNKAKYSSVFNSLWSQVYQEGKDLSEGNIFVAMRTKNGQIGIFDFNKNQFVAMQSMGINEDQVQDINIPSTVTDVNKPFIIFKTGENKYQYYTLTSNHDGIKSSATNEVKIISGLYGLIKMSSEILNTGNNVYNLKDIFEKFKQVYGFELNADYTSMLSSIYPELQKATDSEVSTFTSRLWIEKMKKFGTEIPDIRNYQNVNQFIEDLMNNSAKSVSKKEIYMSNNHVNIVFTAIENKGNTILTPFQQTNIMFKNLSLNNNNTDNEVLESYEDELKEKIKQMEEKTPDNRTEVEKLSLQELKNEVQEIQKQKEKNNLKSDMEEVKEKLEIEDTDIIDTEAEAEINKLILSGDILYVKRENKEEKC